MLSNRSDFTLSKKPPLSRSTSKIAETSSKMHPVYRAPPTSPRTTTRTNEFKREFPVITTSPRVSSVQRSFSELVRHRPWRSQHVKILESKHVQTEPTTSSHQRVDLPPVQRPTVPDKKQYSQYHHHQQQQQPSHQSTNTDSSMFLKKQESSNFSMFKGMNSNDLYNYIDDVINQFRVKTNMFEFDEDGGGGEENMANLTEFSNTIFYPEDRELNQRRSPEDELVNLRGRGGRKFDRVALNDLSTILSSDNDDGGGGGANKIIEVRANDGYLESRSFSNHGKEESTQNDEDLEVEAESSTFINYTHSFEIDDESDLLEDETLSNS